MVTPPSTGFAPALCFQLATFHHGVSLARLLFSLRCIVRREPISQGLEHVAPSIATSDPTPRRGASATGLARLPRDCSYRLPGALLRLARGVARCATSSACAAPVDQSCSEGLTGIIGVHDLNDVAAVDALEVDRGDAEVAAVAELALDDDQRTPWRAISTAWACRS